MQTSARGPGTQVLPAPTYRGPDAHAHRVDKFIRIYTCRVPRHIGTQLWLSLLSVLRLGPIRAGAGGGGPSKLKVRHLRDSLARHQLWRLSNLMVSQNPPQCHYIHFHSCFLITFCPEGPGMSALCGGQRTQTLGSLMSEERLQTRQC